MAKESASDSGLVLRVLLLVAAYWVSAQLGLQLALPGTNVTPVWPPAAVALLALMLGGWRYLPGIFFAAAFVNYQQLDAVQDVVSALLASLPVALGNTLEAALAYALLRHAEPEGTRWFVSVRSTIAFPLACVAGAAVAASIATVTLMPVAQSVGVWQFFFTWLFGDAASMVLLVPLLMSLVSAAGGSRIGEVAWWLEQGISRRLERLIYYPMLVVVSVALFFFDQLFSAFAFVPLYVLLPVVVWGCLSLAFGEVAFSLCLITTMAIVATVSGMGPFVRTASDLGLLQLQTFMLVVGSAGLVLVVGVGDHRRLSAALRASNDRLEERVQARVSELHSLNDVLDGEIRMREHSAQVFLAEKRVLDLMAHGASLDGILLAINEVIRQAMPGGVGSVLLLEADGKTMRVRSAPDLPDAYNAMVDGMQVGPEVGSCGPAIYFDRTFIVADMMTHPNWAPFLDMVRPFGLGACWSTPIRNRRDEVLGSFAIYFFTRREPSDQELQYLERLSHLAGIAVEYWKAQEALIVSEQMYRSLYNDNPAMFFTLDTGGMILSVNEFGARHLGWAPDELIGVHYSRLMAEPDEAFVAGTISRALELNGEVFQFETRKVSSSGQVIWVKENYRATRNDKGELAILVVSEDITDIHNLSRKLAHHASHDALTGLINRRQFETELAKVVFAARQNNSRHALCYMDLDQFKVVNDTSGHVAGDELLRQLGHMLQEVLAGRGILARLGGDEFGLILTDCAPGLAESVALELRDAIAAFQFVWASHSYHVGVSIGIVHIDAQCMTPDALLGAADAACFAAKEAGRNRIHVYREDDRVLAERRVEMQWVNRIPRGIRERRFELAAQDIFPLQEGSRARMHTELLIRYRNSAGQWVSPAVFLPPAERYGMATQIDRYVVGEVIALYLEKPWVFQGQRIFNINLSGQSLSNEEFLAFLQARVAAGELPVQCICFEITETAAISNLASATVFMRAMKSLGCQFALDDFGSGLSSFGYLKTLPVDYLKIDGMFVKDVLDDPVDEALVKAIHDIGHVLGKQTIAEFVENDAIQARIRMMGVDYAQGYGLARPVPLAQWLDDLRGVLPL